MSTQSSEAIAASGNLREQNDAIAASGNLREQTAKLCKQMGTERSDNTTPDARKQGWSKAIERALVN